MNIERLARGAREGLACPPGPLDALLLGRSLSAADGSSAPPKSKIRFDYVNLEIFGVFVKPLSAGQRHAATVSANKRVRMTAKQGTPTRHVESASDGVQT